MALILLIAGAVLYFMGRIEFGTFRAEGRHVKAAGVVLMLPAGAAIVLRLGAGMVFGGNPEMLMSLLSVIGMAEFIGMLIAAGIAYILIANPANAPRLPGVLGEIQAGIPQSRPYDAPPRPQDTQQDIQDAAPAALEEVAPEEPAPAPPPPPRPHPTMSDSARDRMRAKKVLTLAEAANYLGMTEAQVLELIDKGRLTAARINYRYQFATSQLDEFLQKRDTGMA